MKVINLDKVEQVTSPRGVAVRHLIDQPEVAVVNITLKAGEVLPVHRTPVDVFFYIHQGTGTVVIGDEREVVKRGEIVLSPKNVPHGLIASEEDDFSVLVVKTPNPKV